MDTSQKVQAIKARNLALSQQTFGGHVTQAKVVEGSGVRVDGVTDLFGKSVKTSPQRRDLRFEVNGGAKFILDSIG